MNVKKLILHTETTIDSAHYLKNYDGKCANLHGHTWFIEVWVKGSPRQLDDVGILFDFTHIKKIKEKFDHKLINELDYFAIDIPINPTAENITMIIYEELKKIRHDLEYKVRVYETKVGKETYCEYGDF